MTMPANLKKRLITGFAMTFAIAGVLFGDEYLVKRSQFLFVCVLSLAFIASYEFNKMQSFGKSRLAVLWPALFCLIVSEWVLVWDWRPSTEIATTSIIGPRVVLIVLVFFAISAFLEILDYEHGGQAWPRFCNTMIAIVYLGVLPLFLIKLRSIPDVGMLAFSATIFVPKLGDVGAYFTGSLIGKHKMTPTLSPKKTWEGFAGGLAVSVLTAIVINSLGREPLFKNGVVEAIAFGIVVGIAGVLGDLFESMLKRDAQAKDAAQSLPGFGGVLDVVDSVLFAAPVAYLFFILAG